MRPSVTLTFAILLVAAATATAGEPVSVSAATERGRSLDRILDALLVPRAPVPEEGRTVALVVDPTSSLAAARFSAALRSALRRNASRLVDTRFSIVPVDGGSPDLPPTGDPDAIAEAARAIEARPTGEIQDVYAAVRRAAAALAKRPGAREVVLVSLENGDAERNLERTIKEVRRAGVAVSAITRPAFLSDTWWLMRPGKGPDGYDMGGPESAFVEVPFSFRLQNAVANEAVSSGFATFGISRIVTATGGRVFLHYPEPATHASCMPPAPGFRCAACRRDHITCGESYETHRLRALAPRMGPRREVAAALAKDPAFQAVHTAWNLAAEEGILTFRSPVEWSDGSIRIVPLRYGKLVLLGDSLALGVQRDRAEKMARACDGIIDRLGKEIRLAGKDRGSPRQRAVADLTSAMLEISRFNLIHYAAFCRDVAPELLEKRESPFRPPEIPVLRPDYIFSGILFENLSLCHGTEPFEDYRLPGGAKLSRELARLSERLAAFRKKHAHTPFQQVIRRQGLAVYRLRGRPQKGVPPPRWLPPTRKDPVATPPPQRPPRSAPAGGGAGDTPASGGK